MTRFRFALAVALCAALPTIAAAADPFDGTWRLNTAKSKYDPGPAPDSATVSIQTDGVTSTVKIESTFEGKPYTVTYKATLDGTPAPLQGSPVADMISIKRIDDRTREMKTTKAGSPVGESRATVSADGKTVTVTGSGLTPKGTKTTFTAVYEKQ
jgi:hypothetical protein